jgi:preprotein translocase subunit YajC
LNQLQLVLAMIANQAAPAAGGGNGSAAAPVGGCAGGAGGGLTNSPILLMGLMFVVFYFLLIRPQQKKAKEHTKMLEALKKGDQVITRGGMIGKVSGVQDNILVLEVQEKVRVRVLKSYVEGKLQEGTATSAASGKSETAESKN